MTLIKNIIFDFGGVIYDIDFSKGRKAFFELGIKNFDQLYSQANQNHLFEKLEIDSITPEYFRNELRALTKKIFTDVEIDVAWNSLLIGFDQNRLNLLQKLKKNYRIFLFSNTNRIHHAHFLKQFKELTNYKTFDGLFIKSFFSFEIKKRKPNIDAYQHLFLNMNLKPEETLFIDDSIQNIEPAKKMGIKCWHLKGEVLGLFEDNLLKQKVLSQLD